MYTENDYILWLSRVNSIGITKMHYLINYFGCAKEVFYAKEQWLSGVGFLTKNEISNIISNCNGEIIDTYKKELYEKNIRFIIHTDSDFPEELHNIPSSPFGLYLKGELPDKKYKKISIVGSRKVTDYGATCTYKISKELAQNDVVIVSGMASGIDSIAHKAALDAGGKTIAVLGCGVDVCYPESNRDLMKNIIKNGCIISEYPPGTEPFKGNFPVRNRIISGLSDILAVMEASVHSGTMITVNHALEQGKDIFALPGNITSKLSQGTNYIIKQGAMPLTETDDILFALGINKEKKSTKEKKEKISLESDEKIVYDCISLTPITVDEIVMKTGINISQLQYILTMFELKGIVERLPGQKYISAL